jgi:hypothetical protein
MRDQQNRIYGVIKLCISGKHLPRILLVEHLRIPLQAWRNLQKSEQRAGTSTKLTLQRELMDFRFALLSFARHFDRVRRDNQFSVSQNSGYIGSFTPTLVVAIVTGTR